MRSVTRALLPILTIVLAVGLVHAAKERLDPYVAGVNGVSPPSPVEEGKIAPVYPPAARAKGIEAAVVISAVVRRDGTVANVEVVDCDAPGYGFEDAVRSAVRQWRFEPGSWKGRPVDTVSKFRIRLATPSETAGDLARRLIDPTARLFAMPIAGGAVLIGTPGGLVMPTLDPGTLDNRPVAVVRPRCSPGKADCLYDRSPGVASEIVALPRPPSLPFEPILPR